MKASFSSTIFLLFAALSVSAHRHHADGETFDVQAWLAEHRTAGVAESDLTHLLRFKENQEPIPFTEAEMEALIAEDGPRFYDVIDHDLEAQHRNIKRQAMQTFATKVKPVKPVKDMVKMLDINNLRTYIGELQSIFTRYYTAPGGLEAPTVIFDRLTSIIGNRPDASVRRFTNTFAQDSIIARIEGSSPTDTAVTIAGAHLDSIGARTNPAAARAPGADDDGSSVSNLIETFRVLVQSGYKPRSPIEVQFYAAEEVGVRGSTAIVADYTNTGKEVKAMCNFDMTAYNQPGLNFTMGFVTDRTSASLNRYTKSVAANYVLPKNVEYGRYPINITNDYCGYACSDHAPWNTAGVAAVYPFEAITETSNPSYHNAFDLDTAEGFSYEHLLQFSELLIGFFYHLTS